MTLIGRRVGRKQLREDDSTSLMFRPGSQPCSLSGGNRMFEVESAKLLTALNAELCIAGRAAAGGERSSQPVHLLPRHRQAGPQPGLHHGQVTPNSGRPPSGFHWFYGLLMCFCVQHRLLPGQDGLGLLPRLLPLHLAAWLLLRPPGTGQVSPAQGQAGRWGGRQPARAGQALYLSQN